jgi:hypothetical protein
MMVPSEKFVQFWIKSCLRKVRYKKLAKAVVVGKKFNQHAYYCDNCAGYHLTKRKIV